MAKKRDALTQAALNLFVEKGIQAATTKEIARRARISEGTIYRHFHSKEEMALKLFLTYMEQFAQALEQGVAPFWGPAEKLKAAIKNFLDFARRQPIIYKYVVLAHHSELKKVSAEKLKPKEVFVRIIREGIAKGEFRKMDPNLAAAMIIGMLARVNLFLEHGLIRLSYKKVVEEVGRASLAIVAV